MANCDFTTSIIKGFKTPPDAALSSSIAKYTILTGFATETFSPKKHIY